MFRKIFFLVFVLVTGAGLYIFFRANQGPVDVTSASASEVSAGALYRAFLHDTAAASDRYAGRILEVTGIIEDATVGNRDLLVIRLTGALKDGGMRATAPAAAGAVNCTMQPVGGKTPAKPAVGASVRVRGICSGLGEGDADLGIPPDVYLERCIIIQ